MPVPELSSDTAKEVKAGLGPQVGNNLHIPHTSDVSDVRDPTQKGKPESFISVISQHNPAMLQGFHVQDKSCKSPEVFSEEWLFSPIIDACPTVHTL